MGLSRITARFAATRRAFVACALSLALMGALGPVRAHEHQSALTISGTPPGSVSAGQSYSFTPTTTDWRSRTLAFAIANKPAWATFSTSNGQLSGTPAAGSAGTYPAIVIAVSDGFHTATLPAFAVQVTAPASAALPPVISGTPPTNVTAGSAYAFEPNASDPGGATLSFSVQNKPAWANFSIANGMLNGTPSGSQTGTYSGIVISASDGQHSSALPAFSITVAGATTGSAVLAVTPPTVNTDGSALTDLAGLRLYYGTSPTNLTQLVQLSATQTSYTLSSLASGTWYFGATAYSSAGTESVLSAIVSKSIP
jgi:hypothetical protein